MTELPPRIEGTVPLRDAATAADAVPDEATLAVSGFGSVGYPKAVPSALATAAVEGRPIALTVVSGGSVGPEIDTELIESGAVKRRCPFQATPTSRTATNERGIEFIDRGIAGMSDEIRFGRLADPDVAVVEAVAVGSDWLIPSMSIGQTPAYVAAADELIVEVNDAQPRSLARLHDVYERTPPPNREPIPLKRVGGRIGSPRIRFEQDKLRAVVRTDTPDDPYEFRDPTDADIKIASQLLSFLEAECDQDPAIGVEPTLQFGVGSLGNALMGQLTNSSLAGDNLRYFGEVIQDGLLDLLDTGGLAAASATSLALSTAGQQRLFEDIERYSDQIVLRPSAISNAPAMINRFGVVAINAAVGVDLYGHVNSTHVRGSRLLNGVGGSVDFNQNAHLTIAVTRSTAGGDDVSAIVPMVPHVDHTEHDIDVLITEHGTADLRGLSPVERAEAILDCADPTFRPDLRAYVDRALEGKGHQPHDLETVFNWR